MINNTCGELTAVPGSPGGPGSPGKPTGPYRQNETTRHWAALVCWRQLKPAQGLSEQPKHRSSADQLTYRVTLWTVISRGSSGTGGSSSSRWASISLLTRLPPEALSRNMSSVRTTTTELLMQQDESNALLHCCWMKEAEWWSLLSSLLWLLLLLCRWSVVVRAKIDVAIYIYSIVYNSTNCFMYTSGQIWMSKWFVQTSWSSHLSP